jgi:asparagine synthase (glutamine-hydrolysing)
MCGIVGGFGEKAYSTILNNMNLLHRRGPDSSGILNLECGLVLGATRLAMTDPHPRSNQPMTDDDSGNVVIFNGEIYNYLQIKKNLVSLGLKFITHSDTEVLLKALTYYGFEVIPKLQGMFAFAFFNKLSNTITLSRDFLGKKPLYYFLEGENLFFSSQINLIKKFNSYMNLDFSSVQTYLKYGYLMDPQTMYTECKAILPGELIEIDLDQKIILKKLNFTPSTFSENVSVDLKSELRKAIEERIVGHEDKFALSLSGGVDSSILAIECAHLKLPVTAYSLSWLNPDKARYNIDSELAEKTANQLQINFKKIQMPNGKNIFTHIENYVKAMGEPNANPSGLSMMELYSKIKEDGHRLVLTGDGADEVFGGYDRYRKVDLFNNFPEFNFRFLGKLIQSKSKKNYFARKASLALFNSQSDLFWNFFHQNIDNKLLNRILDTKNFSVEPKLLGSELFSSFKIPRKRLANLMFKDLRTWLSMESNRKLDRVSMWHSIEARSPFQSEQVINYGYKQMESLNFSYGNKILLHKAFPVLKTLPVSSRKAGFISPVGDWLRSNPALVQDSLTSLPAYLPFNKKELNSLYKATQNGDYTKLKLLWSLVILNYWFEFNK